MRKLLAVLAVLFATLSVASEQAPAATVPSSPVAQAASSDGSATFYFYRLRKFYANALKPSVYSDKEQILRMRNGRFVELHLPSGTHTLTSNFPGNGLVIDAKAGETYYIRMEMTQASFMHTAKGEIFRVDPARASSKSPSSSPANQRTQSPTAPRRRTRS